MNCPACKSAMVEENFGDVKVDVCKSGCKSLWFDWKELMQLDETHEGFGDALKEAVNSPRMKDTNRGKLRCPKCNIPMILHLYESSKVVTVDECYNCGGFFLDSGELKIIRDTFMSPEEKKAYLDELFKPHVNKLEAEFKESEERTQAIKKIAGVLSTNVVQTIIYGPKNK